MGTGVAVKGYSHTVVQEAFRSQDGEKWAAQEVRAIRKELGKHQVQEPRGQRAVLLGKEEPWLSLYPKWF